MLGKTIHFFLYIKRSIGISLHSFGTNKFVITFQNNTCQSIIKFKKTVQRYGSVAKYIHIYITGFMAVYPLFCYQYTYYHISTVLKYMSLCIVLNFLMQRITFNDNNQSLLHCIYWPITWVWYSSIHSKTCLETNIWHLLQQSFEDDIFKVCYYIFLYRNSQKVIFKTVSRLWYTTPVPTAYNDEN
jgi:hypothetical protein